MSCGLAGWLIPALALAQAQAGSPARDPRYTPITKADLISSIARTKRESSEHYILIDRAVYSDLGKVAYDEYSKISRSHPKDAMALLHAGFAGLAQWDDLCQTDVARASLYLQFAGRCFARAYALDPRTPEVQREHGYYLWQFGTRQPEGRQLLQRAAIRLPRDPRAHELLASVYLIGTGKEKGKARARNRVKAISESLTAVRLDPIFAAPHFYLACRYAEAKDFRKANAELDAYLRLVPPNVAERQDTKVTLNWIRKHK